MIDINEMKCDVMYIIHKKMTNYVDDDDDGDDDDNGNYTHKKKIFFLRFKHATRYIMNGNYYHSITRFVDIHQM